MDFSPTAELECLLCHNFKSDPASLFDHQIECHKLPEHQARSDELLLNFVTSLARRDAEHFASELFKIDNATHEKKLTAALERSDRKREKSSIKSVTTATGTSAVTERENKARNGGRGGGKGNNKKGWSRGRGRGDRGIRTRGRGFGGNNSAIGEPIDSGVQEGKGNQVVQEDEERASLIAKMENRNDCDEVEGELILYKGKITNDSDEVEGEVILWKGRNFA